LIIQKERRIEAKIRRFLADFADRPWLFFSQRGILYSKFSLFSLVQNLIVYEVFKPELIEA
jgi:hypothetical protein